MTRKAGDGIAVQRSVTRKFRQTRALCPAACYKIAFADGETPPQSNEGYCDEALLLAIVPGRLVLFGGDALRLRAAGDAHRGAGSAGRRQSGFSAVWVVDGRH